MLTQKTVFVLGAGSSVDFGLPTGPKLINDVISAYQEIRTEPEHLRGLTAALYGSFHAGEAGTVSDLNCLIGAAARISRNIGQFQSIDDYLFTHGQDRHTILAGKLAISAIILQYEQRSENLKKLHSEADRASAMASLGSTWIGKLWGALISGCRCGEEENAFRNVAFINFNYDRCIEQYLYYALQHSFACSPDRAKQVMFGLPIFHPYGQVGLIPFQSLQDERPAIQFGTLAARAPLKTISQSIRTFTEGLDDEVSLPWRRLIKDARRVVFLGFGFHQQNMALLSTSGIRESPVGPEVFSTAFGMSDPNKKAVSDGLENTILGRYKSAVFSEPGKDCAGFMDDFMLSLKS